MRFAAGSASSPARRWIFVNGGGTSQRPNSFTACPGRRWRSRLSASRAQAAYFFLFAALTVVTAIRMLFAASVMPILHAGTVPVTAALALRFLMTGDPFYWIMAVVAIGIHFYFVFLVKSLQRTALSMLDYRAEKDRLIEELERAKSGLRRSAHEGRGGRIWRNRNSSPI